MTGAALIRRVENEGINGTAAVVGRVIAARLIFAAPNTTNPLCTQVPLLVFIICLLWVSPRNDCNYPLNEGYLGSCSFAFSLTKH